MLKKLVPALALTGLAFGSGLCFNPYNHNYGVNTNQILDLKLSNYNKTIVLNNGKMQVDKKLKLNIKLVRYITKGNKALMLMDAGDGYEYFVVYTECINGKPITKDIEVISAPSTTTVQVVNDPKYPIKFGFYKDGFWTKGLVILEGNGPSHECDYVTDDFPYKLINKHKTGNAPSKDEELPNRECNN